VSSGGHGLASVAFALGLLVGCPGSGQTPDGFVTVARVGTRTIEAEELIHVLSSLARHGDLPRADAFAGLRDRTLETRIVEEVLLAEAATRGLTAGPELVDEEIAKFLGEPASGAVRSEAEAVHGGMRGWRAVVQRRLTLNQMERDLRRELTEGTSVTPEQIESALGRYADRLTRPAQLRARQLFAADPEVMRSMHARLEEGASFQELADELGLSNGGDLGVMSEDRAPKLLVQTSATLQPGGHSGVLRSPLGYHVFQLISRSPEQQATPEESASMVEGWLVEETVESRLRAWVANRTAELGLEVYEGVRDAVKCCHEGEPYLAPLREKL